MASVAIGPLWLAADSPGDSVEPKPPHACDMAFAWTCWLCLESGDRDTESAAPNRLCPATDRTLSFRDVGHGFAN